jgi:hypothetical protein
MSSEVETSLIVVLCGGISLEGGHAASGTYQRTGQERAVANVRADLDDAHAWLDDAQEESSNIGLPATCRNRCGVKLMSRLSRYIV